MSIFGNTAGPAPLALSERVGRWKANDANRYGAVVASAPFDGRPRMDDNDALAYGGPYLVGESMSSTAQRFIASIPDFIIEVERAADVPCTCSRALGTTCATCLCRQALAHLSLTLEQKKP